MTTEAIVRLTLRILGGGGIVGLDAMAILIMFRQAKLFLTTMPDERDYKAFGNRDRQEKEMAKDITRWRTMAKKIYSWVPWITLASLLIVALAVILSAVFGASVA